MDKDIKKCFTPVNGTSYVPDFIIGKTTFEIKKPHTDEGWNVKKLGNVKVKVITDKQILDIVDEMQRTYGSLEKFKYRR